MVELYKGLWELFSVAFFMVALNLRENELWSLCSVERMIESSLFSDFLSLTDMTEEHKMEDCLMTDEVLRLVLCGEGVRYCILFCSFLFPELKTLFFHSLGLSGQW